LIADDGVFEEMETLLVKADASEMDSLSAI